MRLGHTLLAVMIATALALGASGCTGGSNEAEHPLDITTFRAAVKERFGTPPNEAPWYRHITAISWADEQILEVSTDLEEGANGRLVPPCGVLWRLALDMADKPNSLGVQVEGWGGCA